MLWMQRNLPAKPSPGYAYTLLWLGALSPNPLGRVPDIEAWIAMIENFDCRYPSQGRIVATGRTLIPITMLSRLSCNALWWTDYEKRVHWLELPSPGEHHGHHRAKRRFRQDIVLNTDANAQHIVSGSVLTLDGIAPPDWLDRTLLLETRGAITLSSDRISGRRQTTTEIDVFLPCTEIVRYFFAASVPLLTYIFTGDALIRPAGHRLKGIELYGPRFIKSAHLPRKYDFLDRVPGRGV
jgi:hypothetical protein